MDVVALVSVVSSGFVALAGLVINYRSGVKSREHELRLAYEERTWEKKSDQFAAIITGTRQLLETLSANEHRTGARAVKVWETLRLLEDSISVIEVFGSPKSRSAFDAFRRVLTKANLDKEAIWDFELARLRKESALDHQDFEAAAAARADEVVRLEVLETAFEIDAAAARKYGEALIDALRTAMRG